MNSSSSDTFFPDKSESLFKSLKKYPSNSMNRVINKLINQKFHSDNMLIVGEYGTGKKRTAKILHEISNRSEGPFHSLNCEYLNNNRAHREFFGYAGYPENALHPHKNAFEKSHRGTLYLENFNELNQDLQYTLIRSHINKNTVRIGSSSSSYIDVRLIIGVRPLVYHNFEMFRRKTRMQINIKSLFLPPLRERKKDIPVLAKSFLKKYNYKYDRTVEGISSDVMLQLYKFSWPGNIRQLKNSIQQAICVTNDTDIQLHDLPEYLVSTEPKTFNNRNQHV